MKRSKCPHCNKGLYVQIRPAKDLAELISKPRLESLRLKKLIMQLCDEGLTNADIARALECTPEYVRQIRLISGGKI